MLCAMIPGEAFGSSQLAHSMSLISQLDYMHGDRPFIVIKPLIMLLWRRRRRLFLTWCRQVRWKVKWATWKKHRESESEWTPEWEWVNSRDWFEPLDSRGKHILHKFLNSRPLPMRLARLQKKTHETGKRLAAVNRYFWSVIYTQRGASPSKTHSICALAKRVISISVPKRVALFNNLSGQYRRPTSRFIPLKWSQLVWLGKHFAN